MDFVLGPGRSSSCEAIGQTAQVGQLPLVSWGCTFEAMTSMERRMPAGMAHAYLSCDDGGGLI